MAALDAEAFTFSVLFLWLPVHWEAALDRQPNADYHARREALAKKAGGVVVLFAPLEAGDAVYGFRQDDNFYYLSGMTEPGEALLIAPAVEAKEDAKGNVAARPYTEILFLPPRNVRMEKCTGPKLGAGQSRRYEAHRFRPRRRNGQAARRSFASWLAAVAP